MPVTLKVPLRRLSQSEFGDIAYEVIRHAFAIHHELGRFFDERIYKNELARRMPGVTLEVPIEIDFESFHKCLYLDMLVDAGAVFEFKTVEKLTGMHRAQLIQYLLLCELPHGKLINMRPGQVEHEFVNATQRFADRTQFETNSERWNDSIRELAQLREYMVALLRDLGTGLSISLYEEAATQNEMHVGVFLNGHELGEQRVRLIAPDIALKISGFDSPSDHFETHARRWLAHVNLSAIAWINIGKKKVTFTTIHKSHSQK